MSLVSYHNTAILQFDDGTTGNAGASVPVTIRVSATNEKATIYDLNEVSLANPLTTDNLGNYAFKINSGSEYDIIINEGGSPTTSFYKVNIGGAPNDVIKQSLTVVPGQLIYPIPGSAPIDGVVVVDNCVLSQSDGAYSFNVGNDLVLSEPLFANQVLEIWSKASVPAAITSLDYVLPFETIALALVSTEVKDGMTLNIAENVTTDSNLYIWDVVQTSTVTPNGWNIVTSTVDPLLSIKLRGTENFIKRKNFAPMDVIAHRGFEQAAVENTILAFSIAASHGVDLECDCQASADGTIWMFHDTSLASDTNLTGNLYQSTDAYIETGTFTANTGTSLASQRLSKFEDFLYLASSYSLRIYPELKEPAGWSNGDVNTFLALLDAYGYLNQNCVIQTVSTSLLTYVRSQNSDVGIAYLGFQPLATAKADIDAVFALGGASAVYSKDSLLGEPALVEYLFNLGMNVYAWTVNDVDEALALKRIGINGLMTNTLIGGG